MALFKIQNRRRAKRQSIAFVMTIIYLLITLSPLASIAMHSKSFVHVVTGECTGDCDTCGCSPASRSDQTCCCARKRQQQTGFVKLSRGDCCSNKPAPTPVSKKSCCPTPESLKPVIAQPGCCSKSGHDDRVQEAEQNAAPAGSEVVYKCGGPCSKAKQFAMIGAGTSELLPYFYSEMTQIIHADTPYPSLSQRMTSRHAEPPDPPPKLSLHS